MKNSCHWLLLLITLTLASCITVGTPSHDSTPKPQSAFPTTQDNENKAPPTPNFLTDDVTLEFLNSVPPEGIIEEVTFFSGGMGGAGCFDDRFRSPAIFPELPKSIELVPIEEFRTIQVSLCGMTPGESIQLQIRNEETDTVVMKDVMTAQSISGQKRGYVDFSTYTFPMDSPIGEYIFIVIGSNWTLQHSLIVEEPYKAHLWLQNSTLTFYNFRPEETIKLLVYTDPDNLGHWKHIGWNQVKMKQDGSFVLRANIENTPYIGYVALRNNLETIPSVRPEGGTDFAWNTFSCEGAPHRRGIGPGKLAMVISDYKSDLEFGSGNSIEIGMIVRIDTGPACNNHRLYWSVVCEDGSCIGTVPEGGPDGFYLQPVDESSLTQASPSIPAQSIETINPNDKAALILIPQGSFNMGLNPDQYETLIALGGSKDLLDASKPAHTVKLDGYNIYKTEVSNLMYSQCVAAGDCKPPLQYSLEDRSSYYDNPNYANYPVVYVTWYMAQNYCQWAGGRLPTEAEWEYAARGSNDLLFPWGDQTSNLNELANVGGRYSGTSSVHSYLPGASPFGLLNMTGNVWEWVYDWYRADYYATNTNWDNPIGPESGDNRNGELKTGKGGSYWISIANSSPTIRDWYQANQAGSAVGFRCVTEK